LDDFRAKINQDLTSYGRLTSPNEWKNYNKFTSKVTMSGGLELLGNSPFNLIHNGETVTSLSTNGSFLKGPLRVDGDVVYTKSEIDILKQEIKNIKKNLLNKLIIADAELLYTQDGKIQWPAWVTNKTKVEIQAWGGGGSGGSAWSYCTGGGGGGGGCSVWYGYKASLNGHEDIIIGKGGTSVVKHGATGNSGGTTTVGNNFITATGGKGGGKAYYSDPSYHYSGSGGAGGAGGAGKNFGWATDGLLGFAKGGNGYAGTSGIDGEMSGNGGDAGGDTSKGGGGGTGQASYGSGKAGRGFGGGGAGSNLDGYYSGAGADGAVLIRLWKE
ncbi:Bgr_08870 family protein, partial [Bartonella tribocorum]|uniref:Bgr_08870 family protein n=1 Tax=Bartonella tribocorum TaxID=85701 RepID=UPI001ABA0E78